MIQIGQKTATQSISAILSSFRPMLRRVRIHTQLIMLWHYVKVTILEKRRHWLLARCLIMKFKVKEITRGTGVIMK